jgi:hypothetical protein
MSQRLLSGLLIIAALGLAGILCVAPAVAIDPDGVKNAPLYAIFDPATGATSFLCTEGTADIQVMVAGRLQTVTITAGQVTTVVPGRAPSAPAPPTPAQQAAITSRNVATTGAGTYVLNAPLTQISVPTAASVRVRVEHALAAAPPLGTPPPTAPALAGPPVIHVQHNP